MSYSIATAKVFTETKAHLICIQSQRSVCQVFSALSKVNYITITLNLFNLLGKLSKSNGFNGS